MLNKSVIKGSFVLFIAFGLFNFFNFVYQIMMARYLSVAEYGILATLFSMIYIFSIFSESIQTIIAKYTVESKNNGKLKNLISRSLKKGSTLATKLFIAYLIISILLAYLLNINYILLALNGFILYFMFLLPVTRGAMQGRKKFLGLGVNLVSESLLKIVFAFIFVLFGWKVYGAIGGFVVGTLFAFFMSFIPLREIYRSDEEKFDANGIYSYARPTTFITAIIVLFYSIDVLIAKIMFAPEIAGAYAIASILGKIILWSSVPIGKAMFPLSAESEKHKIKGNIFGTTLVMILIIIFGALIVFHFFSDLIISLFSGGSIPESSSILFYLGIAFSFISLANIILLYRLSKGPIKKYFILITCNILEVLILFIVPLIIAPNNLVAFAITFVISSMILLIGSILFVRANRHI